MDHTPSLRRDIWLLDAHHPAGNEKMLTPEPGGRGPMLAVMGNGRVAKGNRALTKSPVKALLRPC